MKDAWKIAGFLTALLWLASAPVLADSRFAFSVDLPVDDGLPTGTIFSIEDAAGAGFSFANNTQRTANSRVVTFFARGGAGVRVTDLGKPFADSTTFGLVDMGEELVAVAYSPEFLKPRHHNKTSGGWQDLPMPGWTNGVTHLGGFQVVNGNPLYLYADAPNLYYAGSAVAGDQRFAGKKGYGLLYAAGKLYLFFQADGPDFMYVCDWMPGQHKVENCVESSFGIDVWLYSLFPVPGGVGVTDTLGFVWQLSSEGVWTTHRYANSASFQVYSALEFENQWWLGQFPSGNLVRWPDLTEANPAIGKQTCGDSSEGREAQSLGVSMGKVVAGVWPWGEVWSGAPGASWSLLARVFPYPDNDCGAAPFMAQATAAGVEGNALGQRIFGIASWGTGVAVSATMKNPYFASSLDHLSAAERAPYGSVFLIEQDYELSCEVLGSGAMDLSFILTPDTMEIRKDNAVLCSRSIDGGTLRSFAGPVLVGDGPWGRFAGEVKATWISR